MMKVSDDVICQVCKKSFCCAECRYKHEIKSHVIAIRRANLMTKKDDSLKSTTSDLTCTTYLFCPICAQRPFLLKKEMYSELLEHIEKNHLPLSCQKCFKVYTKIGDLKEFSKCIQPQELCRSDRSVDELEVKNKDASNFNTNTVHITTATQTSPMRTHHEYNDSHITPISMLNLHWKVKNKVMHEEIISDSVSSIKNLSSISNSSIARSIGIVNNSNKGKLVRSTSTPLQAEVLFAKPKEQAFNGSSEHVSSIHNSGCDSESSIPSTNPVGTPTQQSLEVNRYRSKVGGRPRMTTVTPLRQVMSKSIQKAFAEHGIAGAVRGGQNRRKMFESIDGSIENPPTTNVTTRIPSSPLDLRLSPALRRTSSEPSTMRNINDPNYVRPPPKVCHEILLSAKKTTTESIVITRMQNMASVESVSSISNHSTQSVSTEKLNGTSNGTNCSGSNSSSGSVYQTCRSVEIITSTELSAVKVERNSYGTEEGVEDLLLTDDYADFNQESHNFVPITPTARTKGAVIKKNLIVFETPREEINSQVDVFFTPEPTPVRKIQEPRQPSEAISKFLECKKSLEPRKYNNRFSPSRRPALRECALSSTYSRVEDMTFNNFDLPGDDDVFTSVEEADQQENKKPQASSLWSLMTSVMHIPSLKGGQKTKTNDSTKAESTSRSIIKRCVSIAGSIVRSKTLDDDEQLQSLKRKRTYTTDNQSTYLSHLHCPDISPVSDSFSASSKRFRIQGRKPIERMRVNS